MVKSLFQVYQIVNNTLQKHCLYLLVGVLLLGVLSPCSAQIVTYGMDPNGQTDIRHYGWFALDAGYHVLLENYDDLSTIGGARTSISLGYELQHNNFYFSIGGAFSFWSSRAKTDAMHREQLMRDTQGKNMIYKFDMERGDELSYGLTVSLPVIFGYTSRGWNIGGGVRVGYHVLAENISERAYTTSATYPQYFEDFVEMPNHYYSDYIARNKQKLSIMLPLSVLVEGGYDVLYIRSQGSRTRHNVLRIGFYAEYGFIKAFNNEKDLPYVDVNKQHPTKLDVFAYYNRKSSTSHFVFPLSVGIKVTYLLRIPTRNCHCYD